MPKLKRALSVFLAIWLCVMLVTFTYTWVSRNWTPSINSNNMSIATAGALVISLTGDESFNEVDLNSVIGINKDSSFVFRQVSSQDAVNFFWKDFTPTLTGEPALFMKIDNNDTHKEDYIDSYFYLKLDDKVRESKYVFIHPETLIQYAQEELADRTKKVEDAMRIALTYEKKVMSDGVEQTVTDTIILANLEENDGSINVKDGVESNDAYRAVASGTLNGTREDAPTALGYQPVYGLQYFNCGRNEYNYSDDGNPENDYDFVKDPSKAMFEIAPGEQVKVYIKIWLEGQDLNCEKEIAGNEFRLVLKFDSVYVNDPNK